MIEYVAGFLFNESCEQVVLIRKLHPAWMKNKLNAVGGKIKEGEAPFDAMCREFFEETGSRFVSNWKPFCLLIGEGFKVHFFWATTNDQFFGVKTQEEEEIIVCEVNELPGSTMTNLRWLMEMALSMPRERATTFVIEEKYT